MSLTNDIAAELYSISLHKSCCTKAFLCGLLYTAKKDGLSKKYTASFYREQDALYAAQLIDSKFAGSEKSDVVPITRGGHRAFALTFTSKALCNVFSDIDTQKASDILGAVGFRCPDCISAFLRGVFISCATLSKPKNGYDLEISVDFGSRADLLQQLLCDRVAAPGRIMRSGHVGLYYKSSGKIADILYFIGAAKASFELTNFSIEREIRNNENRATNFVTSNIVRSVDANRRCIEAIRYIIDRGAMQTLSEELQATAQLRLEYDSASLSELASLHMPPISKSGLNARLRKLLAIAQKLDKEGQV